MRGLLWFLLLLALFALAARWHGVSTDSDRARRDEVWARAIASTEAPGSTAAPSFGPPLARRGSRGGAADFGARVVVGRPSRAPVVDDGGPAWSTWRERVAAERAPTSSPADAPERVPGTAAAQVQGAGGAHAELPPTATADFELVVSAGQTLSQICEAFYGTARGGIVPRLARYNGLTDADAIRAGHVLLLPNAERLEALAPPASSP